MEDLEWVQILFVVAVVILAPLAQWWIRRQQRAQQEAEARRRAAPPPPPPADAPAQPDRRTVFYGGPAQPSGHPGTATGRAVAGGTSAAPRAPDQLATGPTPMVSAGRTPARPAAPPPPAGSPQVRLVAEQIRRRAQARPAPAPQPQADEPALEEVGALARHHLRELKPDQVSALRKHRLEADMHGQVAPGAATRAAAPAAKAAARARPLFHRDMLRGGNAARAFILAEILGPPKGLQEP